MLVVEDELAQYDVAEVNLSIAVGLPGAEALDVAAGCRKLDVWANVVHARTAKELGRRACRPEYEEFSDAQFRILVMITVLQRTLGVRYNLDFNDGEYDASDSRNLFIHGLLSGHGGTCVTMPVLYVAIGRRLGYPIKLVHAVEHVFCRWDDPCGERLNIEATCPGFNDHRPDEFYLTWPKPIRDADLKRGWYLRNLSPREELADFVAYRGNCCLDNLQTRGANEAYSRVHQLISHGPPISQQWAVATILHRAVERLKQYATEEPLPTEFSLPAPTSDWERRYYPAAQRELQRILANHARRETVAATQAFSELVNV